MKLPPPPCAVLLVFSEGSLEVKLPTIWTDEKQSRAEAERREKLEERRSEKRKSQKKEDADARKGRKVGKHGVFPVICGSGGSKSRLAKAAGAEPAGQMRDEKLHAVVARSTFPSQMYKTHRNFSHFVATKFTFSSGFSHELEICYLKSHVSCEASVNFQHMPQNATPATEFAPCHHFARP